MGMLKLLGEIVLVGVILAVGVGIGYYLFSPKAPGTLAYEVANAEVGSQVILKGDVSLSTKVPFIDKEGFVLKGLGEDKTYVMVAYHGNLPSEGTTVKLTGKIAESHGLRYVEGELVLPSNH